MIEKVNQSETENKIKNLPLEKIINLLSVKALI